MNHSKQLDPVYKFVEDNLVERCNEIEHLDTHGIWPSTQNINDLKIRQGIELLRQLIDVEYTNAQNIVVSITNTLARRRVINQK